MKPETREFLTIIAYVFAGLFLIAFVCTAVSIGLKREETRREKALESNCAHYGDAMNKWAAERNLQQPCPPTERG